MVLLFHSGYSCGVDLPDLMYLMYPAVDKCSIHAFKLYSAT